MECNIAFYDVSEISSLKKEISIFFLTTSSIIKPISSQSISIHRSTLYNTIVCMD